MYFDNPQQAQSLVFAHSYDYTPHFWVDGVSVGSNGSTFGPALEARKPLRSPARFGMHWVPDAERLVVQLEVVNALDPAGEYRIFVAVVEDDIHYLGSNGYPIHDQTFKHMYPDTNGIPVSPDPGVSTFVVDCPLNIGNVYEEWAFENLLAVVYLEEVGGKRVWQAQSRSLSDLIGELEIDLTGVSVARWDTVTVALTVDPVALPVKGIEAEIEFDETKLLLLSIDAGNWYTQSAEDYFFFDYTPAPPAIATSAHFASSFLGGASADSGVVAWLTFIALSSDPIPLSFALAKVRDAGNTELSFAATAIDSIHVTAAGALEIDPRVTNVETIDRFSVALRVEPIARAVMGVEADIDFDESVVRLDSIVPGDWYRASGQDFTFVDYTPAPPDSAGTIHFASSFLSGSSVQAGEVAVFHFSALTAGETALEFALSDVRDVENTEMGFDLSAGDSIVVRSTGALTVDPPLTEVEIIDGFSVSLAINPTSRQIKGVEVEIDFDESVARLDSIVPGTWYTESGNGFFFWDYTPDLPAAAETVHFASSFLSGASAEAGQVARFYFTPLAPGGTELRFDLAKVRDPNNAELHFETSSADSILVSSTGALFIDPSVTTVEELDTFAIDLRINPRSRAVMGIEADIDFDETLARLESISPGPWYTDAGEDYFFFDYTPTPPDSALTIHFASAFLNAVSADSGLVATFHFVAKLAGQTPLLWDLAKVRDASNVELSFATSTLDSIVVEPRTTGVADADPAALGLLLLGNRPNPFNPSTEIHFNLPQRGRWTLGVYDVQGRLQRTLFSELREAGLAKATWDGRDDRGRALGSGVYLARLSGAGESRTGKMILLK